MPHHILITGGCGFIGSNFIHYIRQHRRQWQITNLDGLTYSGNLANLKKLEGDPNYTFVKADIRDEKTTQTLMAQCDSIVHFAAESHVDRSIANAKPFIDTNVQGTQALLDSLRKVAGGMDKRFVHISTDEVYGDLPLNRPDLRFTETSPIQPSSPYAASKAASDLIALAYCCTYGLNVCVTRCSNNFGPYQFPEKVIPLFVTNLIENKKVPLYGDGLNVRDWVHVDDHCQAILAVVEKGSAGEIYNIGGNNEQSNLTLTHTILKILGQDRNMIQPVKDRLGHDRRYAIDSTKILTQLGWQASCSTWPQALETTVQWYIDHPAWWQPLKRPSQNAPPGRR